jgi:hypothetical protein
MAGKAALVLADESTAGPYVTGGAVRLPLAAADAAVKVMSKVKEGFGVPAEAVIHCRVIFHPDARRKSPFKGLIVDDLHEMLLQCTARMNGIGASWWGAWIDSRRYPKDLRLWGKPFPVTTKHLTGLALIAAVSAMPDDFDLAFNPDPTKIDWGLVQRQQATHFARVHPNAIELSEVHRPLLEMADVAAYALAQSRLAALQPDNRKPRRFLPLIDQMSMRTAEMFYTPPTQHVPTA